MDKQINYAGLSGIIFSFFLNVCFGRFFFVVDKPDRFYANLTGLLTRVAMVTDLDGDFDDQHG